MRHIMKTIKQLFQNPFKTNSKPNLISFWTKYDTDTIKAIQICPRDDKKIAKKISIQSTGKISGKLRGQPIYDFIKYQNKIYHFDGAQPSEMKEGCIAMLHMNSLMDNTIIIEPGLRYTQS